MTEPATSLDHLTREDIARHAVRTLHQGVRAQADTFLVAVNGEQGVVKDYGRTRGLFRHVLARYLMAREAKALGRAQGAPGVPRFYGQPDPWSLTLAFVEGRPASGFEPGTVPPEFFDHLRETVDALHARGVLHCDLKRFSNILVTPDWQPWLVDFAGAILRGRWWNLLSRALWHWYQVDDYKAIIKLKRSVAPELVTEQEIAFLEHRGRLERFVRWARMGIKSWARRHARGDAPGGPAQRAEEERR